MDAYKRLERLCGELYGKKYGVSLYIDEMINTPNGEYYVPEWKDDLKKLKHYRWVRNQIAHEPDCREADMCNREDVEWLERFYSRIMNTTDPLARYRKAQRKRTKSAQETKKDAVSDATSYEAGQTENDSEQNSALKVIFWSVVALAAYVIFYFANK